MAEDRTCLDCIAQYSHLPVKLCEEHADERRAGEPRMTLKEWLTKWCNANDGEPQTEWQKGYNAARDMVKIQLKAEKVKTSVTWRQALGDDPA